eukprot:m.53695 g.53695  ORF g.53695 m.53695 type:complete len:624 (+) comp10879_c0_seq1:69-1940(+)
MHVNFEAAKAALPSILQNMPIGWRGTTFRNARLLGRETFANNLGSLIASKTPITTDTLFALGNAEDYLRVATNISCTLEFVLACKYDYTVTQVFTFGSTKMPLVAVALVTKTGNVHAYYTNEDAFISTEEQEVLSSLGCHVECHKKEVPKKRNASSEEVVVITLDKEDGNEKYFSSEWADAIIVGDVLYIVNKDKVSHEDVLVIRKRMSTPITTPMAEARLQELAGIAQTADTKRATEEEVATFHKHLQTLCGTPTDTSTQPVVCTAGLPTTCAMWVSLLQRGGADLLMCSTAYGGSSQLSDIIAERVPNAFKKYVFHIQGSSTDICHSIRTELDKIATVALDETIRHPRLVLFVEIPTNPDMKVPELKDLTSMLQDFKQKTGKEVLLLVDTTFAPGSKIMERLKGIDAALPVVAFISLSKSLSRGMTTGGTLVANDTKEAISFVEGSGRVATLLDTTAKPDQLFLLTTNHHGVELRCEGAYNVARLVGECLCKAVKEHTTKDMVLAFVSSENAAQGFTSSTFSFNLPSPAGATDDINAALAQRFVDLLCKHDEFKPCVSFGQDNGLVYCTVPATSTQGAIKAEHKAKQAVGGVQLVRLSFPPEIDEKIVCQVMQDAVSNIYS